MVNPKRRDTRALIKQPTPIDRWPRGIAYNGGFYVLGTPIGLGNASRAGLRFISSMDENLPPRGRRIIANRFITTSVGVERRGLDALGLDFGRQIKLGRMALSIFPSGLGPGAAQFLMTFKNNRILYCGGVSLRKPMSSQPAEVPACDLLLLDVTPADPRPPASRGVIAKISSWAEAVLKQGSIPVAAVGSINAAFEVMFAFSALQVAVRAQRGLFEIFRRAEPHLSFSSILNRLEQRLPTSGGVIYPAGRWPGSPISRERSTVVAYIGSGRDVPPFADTAFRLGEGEDRAGIVTYVKQTGASQVALGAMCDRPLARRLTQAGIKTYWVVPPQQIPLPFK